MDIVDDTSILNPVRGLPISYDYSIPGIPREGPGQGMSGILEEDGIRWKGGPTIQGVKVCFGSDGCWEAKLEF